MANEGSAGNVVNIRWGEAEGNTHKGGDSGQNNLNLLMFISAKGQTIYKQHQ